METSTKYYIPLGKPILLFFPSSREIETNAEVDSDPIDKEADRDYAGHTVQVSIKQTHRDDIKEIKAFFHAQYDISRAVESVVFAHIFASLPPEICIEGEGYILRGKRKPWTFGKKLDLRWGKTPIQPCKDKWMFTFELVQSLASDC